MCSVSDKYNLVSYKKSNRRNGMYSSISVTRDIWNKYQEVCRLVDKMSMWLRLAWVVVSIQEILPVLGQGAQDG